MMKRIWMRIGMMALWSLAFAACKQDDLPFYTGDKVLVMHAGDGSFVFSDYFPLYYEDIMFAVYVSLLGADGTEAPIPYTLRLNGDVTAMTHESSTHEMQAFDSVYTVTGEPDTLYFFFKRAQVWTDTVYTLAIGLETDSLYGTPFRSTGFTRQTSLEIDDRLAEPDWWDATFMAYFGAFSSRKMRTLFYGLDFVEDVAPHAVYEELGRLLKEDLPGYSARFRQYLADRAAAGNPALERNGEPVSVGHKAGE